MRDKMSVSFDKTRDKFMARSAPVNGKREYLGRFDTRAEAEYVVLQSKPTITENFGKLFDTSEIKPGLLARLVNKITGKNKEA
jgi:hypothetical protein